MAINDNHGLKRGAKCSMTKKGICPMVKLHTKRWQPPKKVHKTSCSNFSHVHVRKMQGDCGWLMIQFPELAQKTAQSSCLNSVGVQSSCVGHMTLPRMIL